MLTTCMYGSVYRCGETLAHATFTQGMLTTCMYDSVYRCEETLAHATFTQRMLTNNNKQQCMFTEWKLGPEFGAADSWRMRRNRHGLSFSVHQWHTPHLREPASVQHRRMACGKGIPLLVVVSSSVSHTAWSTYNMAKSSIPSLCLKKQNKNRLLEQPFITLSQYDPNLSYLNGSFWQWLFLSKNSRHSHICVISACIHSSISILLSHVLHLKPSRHSQICAICTCIHLSASVFLTKILHLRPSRY